MVKLKMWVTYLEIDDDESHDYCGEQIAEIWSVLPINSLLDTIKLVRLGQEEVEKSDDGSLEFGSLISSNGNWGEGFPEDGLTDVGGNEKGDTRSKAVTLLEELVKHEDHESSEEELSNDEGGSNETEFTNWTVHA